MKDHYEDGVDEVLEAFEAPEPEPPLLTLLSALFGSHPHLHVQLQHESLNTDLLLVIRLKNIQLPPFSFPFV